MQNARLRLLARGSLHFGPIDGDGVFVRHDARAEIVGVHLGELRAEEQNLRRIIDPKQEGDERTRRPVGRGGRPAAEVETERPFTECEEKGGDDAPIQTSRQRIFASGRTLKMTAKTITTMARSKMR